MLINFGHWKWNYTSFRIFIEVPTTQEELEEFGVDASGVENYAKHLVDQIRERKGLFVEKKIGEAAEKQRTLARKR